jgi:hypothetical protein
VLRPSQQQAHDRVMAVPGCLPEHARAIGTGRVLRPSEQQARDRVVAVHGCPHERCTTPTVGTGRVLRPSQQQAHDLQMAIESCPYERCAILVVGSGRVVWLVQNTAQSADVAGLSRRNHCFFEVAGASTKELHHQCIVVDDWMGALQDLLYGVFSCAKSVHKDFGQDINVVPRQVSPLATNRSGGDGAALHSPCTRVAKYYTHCVIAQ